ncbi:protein mono-ADP-ribosyltransferase PARP12 [Betta splendens]|uniref:Protein mono-ADP-ribosyltransferase PARP12 n=1 Tax=Betta splendens TaxID=158456 RepID=A0A6P7NEA2_BETSP|nr:protein mono-ADP-ribosyltransferase PARP12 [Betta splendens]
MASGGKRYEWQMQVGGEWLPIDNDHVIESHYCRPGAKGISLNTQHGKVFIDFDDLQTTDPALKVQRVTFLPQGQAEDVGWYFRDDILWREYGSQGSSMASSSVNSRDVEQQYILNSQGTFRFRVGSTGYRLDFSNMAQLNCNTGLRRNVRRRPKFTPAPVSHNPASAPPVTPPSQLPGGGYKWEFMGEEGVWTEYQAHICSFNSAAIEAQYQLNPQGQLLFSIRRFSYTLDFSRMCQINNKIGTTRAVRRTLNDGSQQTSGLGTQPRWQFKDINGIWTDYSKSTRHCSVSSPEIELQYQQDPSGIMNFNTMTFSYELDFSAMTQRNLSTNTTRSVRRLDQ